MSDILIGVIVFGLVFGAAIFGMFLGRNLRVLEQRVNAISNQKSSYITRCYGSLNTFNILFKNKDDQFRTSAADRPRG